MKNTLTPFFILTSELKVTYDILYVGQLNKIKKKFLKKN